MKKKLRMILGILLALILVAGSSLIAFADAGGFAGDTDYGDWGDWGGDSDWDNDNWDGGGGFIWGGDGIGGGGGGIGGGLPIGIIVAVVIVVIVLINLRRGKAGSANRPVAPGAAPTPVTSLRPIEGLKAIDPNFSDAAMTEKIANLYVQMQNAWQAKDFEPMRPYFTDSLYNQFLRQLDVLVKARQTNVVDRIAVLGVNLVGWTDDETNDTLVARVRTRIVDYVISDDTGALVRGSNTKELFMEYEWSLIRRKGVLTPSVDEGPSNIHCANCGAPLDINQSAKCPYCGTVMKNSDYDWVVSAIKGLSQRSGS